jgi:hypothetical protein
VYSLDATYVEWWIRGTLSTCIGSYDAIGGLAEYPQPDDFQFDVERQPRFSTRTPIKKSYVYNFDAGPGYILQFEKKVQEHPKYFARHSTISSNLRDRDNFFFL